MPRRAVAQQRFTVPRRHRIHAHGHTLRNVAYRASTVYSATVTNAGTVPTAPTISYTAVGSWTTVYFENVTAGKTVWINQTLTNGQVLAVDFSARTVTVDGVTVNGVVSVDSRWWDLASGANTVRSNVPASVSHHDAFT